jgi:hypothetical protein
MSNVYLEKLRSISGMPPVRELPKLPKGAYDSFDSTATTRIPENRGATDAHNLDEAQSERASCIAANNKVQARIDELLARHGETAAAIAAH